MNFQISVYVLISATQYGSYSACHVSTRLGTHQVRPTAYQPSIICNGRENLQQLAPIEILTYVRLVDSGG